MNTPNPMEFIHACYVPSLDDGSDAVVIKVHAHTPDGRIVPALKVEDKLTRSFYVTKPQYRNHQFKKEWEELSRLDSYHVPNHRLNQEIETALYGYSGGSYRNKRKSLSEVCTSPYVYGADLHIEVLLKNQYQAAFEASGLKPSATTSGFFDIETNMFSEEKEPNVITVTHENQVYTAILEQFFVVKQPDGTFRRGDLNEFIAFATKTLDHHIEELVEQHMTKNPKSKLRAKVAANPFKYNFYVGKTVIDIIAWIFERIHENKTDFIGIWNLDFDIPTVLDTLKRHRVPYEDIFCPAALPKKYRYVRYERDNKQSPDIFKKWHWLHATSYSQFIDSMCLYRILRTVKGLETSMTLDNILKSNDLGGKLTFKDDDPRTESLAGGEWHRYMQREEAYKYIVYNQFDCISLQLLEWKNDDLASMFILGGVSRLCKWIRQTRKVSDSIYFYALNSNLVTSSPGPEDVMVTEYDRMMEKVGGAVLRPERTASIGLRIFEDRPDLVTFLHNYVNDVDFTGMYPTAEMVCNICKETKISAGIQIEGSTKIGTQNFYSLAVSMQENAVLMGEHYFGLPNYSEMDRLFGEHLAQKHQSSPLELV